MMKIILVDDDERLLKLLDEYLSENGMEVQKAASGAEALEILKREKFDVAILDVMMPHMDGLELLKKITREHSELFTIMLTAKRDEIDRVVGLELGADDYVVKPFSPRELIARIKALKRREKKLLMSIDYGTGLEIDLQKRTALSMLYLDRPLCFPGRVLRKGMRYSLAILLLTLLFYSAFSPKAELFGKVIYRMDTREKLLAMTFDDGPNGDTTLKILDILDREGVKATFFLIGKNVEKYPEITREIVRRGHEVGNHSYSHEWRLPLRTRNEVIEEIKKTEKAIYDLTGRKTDMFRPPHGFRSPWMISEIRHQGYEIITWNDMTCDFINGVDGRIVRKEIVSKAKPGSIIVLHDGKDLEHKPVRNNVIESLPGIIKDLKSIGFRFVLLRQGTSGALPGICQAHATGR